MRIYAARAQQMNHLYLRSNAHVLFDETSIMNLSYSVGDLPYLLSRINFEMEIKLLYYDLYSTSALIDDFWKLLYKTQLKATPIKNVTNWWCVLALCARFSSQDRKTSWKPQEATECRVENMWKCYSVKNLANMHIISRGLTKVFGPMMKRDGKFAKKRRSRASNLYLEKFSVLQSFNQINFFFIPLY